LSSSYLHTFSRPTSFTQGRQEANEFSTSEWKFTLQIKEETPDRAINKTFSIPKLTTEGLLSLINLREDVQYQLEGAIFQLPKM
jgi:hypothetical protein